MAHLRDRKLRTWYSRFVGLYPKAYREAYGDEMVETFAAMLADTHTVTEYRHLFVTITKDYVTTILRHQATSITATLIMAPAFVKRNIFIGMGLVIPFFAIVLYNILCMTLYHGIIPDIVAFEARTWTVYSIVLPLAAFFLIVGMSVRRVYDPLRHHEWRQVGERLFNDGLFAGAPIAVLALVAIF